MDTEGPSRWMGVAILNDLVGCVDAIFFIVEGHVLGSAAGLVTPASQLLSTPTHTVRLPTSEKKTRTSHEPIHDQSAHFFLHSLQVGGKLDAFAAARERFVATAASDGCTDRFSSPGVGVGSTVTCQSRVLSYLTRVVVTTGEKVCI